jgi:septum formation protein
MSGTDTGHVSDLVLASTSPYRAELLERLEVPFEALPPDYDEDAQVHHFDVLGPEAFALHLARGKAESLRGERPEAWILAADQVGVLGAEGAARLLRKPGDPESAVARLMELAGRTHELVTGVVLSAPGDEPAREVVDRQRLTMRAFGRAEAADYVARYRTADTVGAYRIEDAGIKLFERIESRDFTGIIGLPLLAVGRLLRDAGLL